MTDGAPIKVMIIDDSLSIRMLLRGIIDSDPNMKVIATARDPLDAEKRLESVQPDVITLDVEMPHKDGITFLGELMASNPIPVVMISTLTQKGSEKALKALELGAVDVIGKPSAKAEDLQTQVEDILSAVKSAAFAKVGKKPKAIPASVMAMPEVDDGYLTADEILPKTKPNIGAPKVIALGASTGGTEALREVLTALPNDLPGIVITQHMSPGFIDSFSARLDRFSKLKVVTAHDGQKIEAGHAYISPCNGHLTIAKRGKDYACKIKIGKKVRRHKPSVDVLFRSVANEAGDAAFAAILTGMGDDGAACLKEIKDAGGFTVAQDEESCVVYGMPRVAVEQGSVCKTLPLKRIADAIEKFAKED